jgi:hypothetical protein
MCIYLTNLKLVFKVQNEILLKANLTWHCVIGIPSVLKLSIIFLC